MQRKLMPIALLAYIGASPIVNAQESTFSLGLGAGYEENINKGIDGESNVMPFFMYEKGNFYVRGPELGYDFYSDDKLKLGVAARYNFGGYSASDSDQLAGMDDRDGTGEVGFTASYDTHIGEFSAAAFADVSSTHKGYQVGLGWEKRFRLSQKWSIAPQAAIIFQSDKYNNYYCGVKAS